MKIRQFVCVTFLAHFYDKYLQSIMDIETVKPTFNFETNLKGDAIKIPGMDDEAEGNDNLDEEEEQDEDEEENEVEDEAAKKKKNLLKDPKQQYLFAVETIKHLRRRLVRRTNTIDEIRKFYLRDIVTMRHILQEVLTEPERELVWKEYEANLPSIDLKQTLKLHAPDKCEFQVRPCEKCGGQLEVILKDSEEVERLKKYIAGSKDRENRWREKLANLDAQIEEVTKTKSQATKSHMEEKKVLYAEMKKLKDEITKVKQETVIMQQANKKLKEENENFGKAQRDLTRTVQKLNSAEQQLSIIQIQNDEAQETLRTLKSSEKALQKELQSTKLELNETRNQKEVLGYALDQAKLERKQTMVSLEKAQERIKEAEQKFEASHHENIENSRRLSSLEGEISQKILSSSSKSSTVELSPVEVQLQQLTETHHKLEAEHKLVLTSLEEKKAEIQQMQSKVNKLVSITRNQEMELRETEEDIEVFEHELTTMQQFIRAKFGGSDADSDAGSLNSEGILDQGFTIDYEDSIPAPAQLTQAQPTQTQLNKTRPTYSSFLIDGENLGIRSTNSNVYAPENTVEVSGERNSSIIGGTSRKEQSQKVTKAMERSRKRKQKRLSQDLGSSILVETDLISSLDDGASMSSLEDDSPEKNPATSNKKFISATRAAKQNNFSPAPVNSSPAMNRRKSSVEKRLDSNPIQEETSASSIPSQRVTSPSNMSRSLAKSSSRTALLRQSSQFPLPPAEILMQELQTDNFFGLPNEKRSQRELDRIRRRSIPENYIFPTASKDTADESGMNTINFGPDKGKSSSSGGVEVHSTATSKTKELLNQSKERLSQIKRMIDKPAAAAEAKPNKVVTSSVKTAAMAASITSKKPKIIIANIPLNPAPENATKLEIILRDEFIRVMKTCPGVAENLSNSIMNALSDMLHKFSNMVYNGFETMFDGLLSHKQSLDFFEKFFIIFQQMSTVSDGLGDVETLTEICNQIVPLAGALAGGNLTQQWQGKLNLPPETFGAMTNTSSIHRLQSMSFDPDDNASVGSTSSALSSSSSALPSKFKDFFEKHVSLAIDQSNLLATESTDPDHPGKAPQNSDVMEYAPRIQLLQESLRKIVDYEKQTHLCIVSEWIVPTLQDWSSAKTIQFELENRMEFEREKVRKPLETKLNALGKELTKMTVVNEKNLEIIKNLEKKIQEYEKYEKELRVCEVKLKETTKQLEAAVNEINELGVGKHILLSELASRAAKITNLEGDIKSLQQDAVQLNKQILSMTKVNESLQQTIQTLNIQRDSLLLERDKLIQEEFNRTQRLVTVGIQMEYNFNSKSIEIQTEFLTPPMDLKTVVVNKLVQSGLKKYPMVFSQSLDYLPSQLMHTSSAAGPTMTSTSTSTAGGLLRPSPSFLLSKQPSTTNPLSSNASIMSNHSTSSLRSSATMGVGTGTGNHHHQYARLLRSDSAGSNDSLSMNLNDYVQHSLPIPSGSNYDDSSHHYNEGELLAEWDRDNSNGYHNTGLVSQVAANMGQGSLVLMDDDMESFSIKSALSAKTQTLHQATGAMNNNPLLLPSSGKMGKKGNILSTSSGGGAGNNNNNVSFNNYSLGPEASTITDGTSVSTIVSHQHHHQHNHRYAANPGTASSHHLQGILPTPISHHQQQHHHPSSAGSIATMTTTSGGGGGSSMSVTTTPQSRWKASNEPLSLSASKKTLRPLLSSGSSTLLPSITNTSEVTLKKIQKELLS